MIYKVLIPMHRQYSIAEISVKRVWFFQKFINFSRMNEHYQNSLFKILNSLAIEKNDRMLDLKLKSVFLRTEFQVPFC